MKDPSPIPRPSRSPHDRSCPPPQKRLPGSPRSAGSPRRIRTTIVVIAPRHIAKRLGDCSFRTSLRTRIVIVYFDATLFFFKRLGANHNLLAFEDSVVDLSTKLFRPTTHDDHITKATAYPGLSSGHLHRQCSPSDRSSVRKYPAGSLRGRLRTGLKLLI